ncbi:acyl-CoA dehydrogenase family protein [Nocardioides humi]|uniref:Acyl-CoA dehydrogenase family protein n=1 Tax=Nocardioides humi TaxID=449461 RepID=A0ABN2AGY2_9ACTN|nr:acyl-CoA dehydrogenase [Nocardioides humi]
MLWNASFPENDWPHDGALIGDLEFGLAEPPTELVSTLEAIDSLVEEEVKPREKHLRSTVSGPYGHLTIEGALSPDVWEARREIQRLAAAAGLYAAHLPKELGGGGYTREEMFFIEERVYQYGTLLAPAILGWTEGPSPMLTHASSELRDLFVDDLVNARTTAAFCNTEPSAGSHVLGLRTSARREGDGWILNGSKAFITNAQYCDVLQINAVTGKTPSGRPELTVFMVSVDTPGVRRGVTTPTIMDDGLTGEIHLENVFVPDSQRLGQVGDGLRLMITTINWRRLSRAGMGSGWMRTLIERSIRHMRGREVARGTLATQQVPQHMLVDMYLRWYAAREASLSAIRTIDATGPYRIPLDKRVIRLTSLIKVLNDNALYEVADTAVQLAGGRGLLKGTPEEQIFRIARNLRIPAGAVEVQKNTIAESLLLDPAS